MQNKQKALNLLGLAMRARKLISGTETVIAGLNKRQVKVVIIAQDIHENTLEKVVRAAKKAQVEIIDAFTAEEIQHAIGKNRKVLGLLDQGFYQSMSKLINEGV